MQLATGLELVAVVSCAAAVGLLAQQSARRGEVQPALHLAVAFFVVSWVEPAYDWGLHAQFSEDFVRLPEWGYLGLAKGGLPAIAAPMYAVYFLAAATAAVAVANWLSSRLALRRPLTLIGVGYVFGFGMDFGVELFGTQTHLWEFTRVADGVVPFAGTPEQLPLGMPIGMGFTFAVATYLLGGTSRGEFLPAVWSRRWAGARHGTLTTALTATVAFGAAMVAALVPYLLTRALELTSVTSRPEDVVLDPPPALGTLVFVVWFGGALALVAIAVARLDRPAVVDTPPRTLETPANLR